MGFPERKFQVAVSTTDSFDFIGGTSPENGYTWYRSDTNELKCLVNGVARQIIDVNGKASIGKFSGTITRATSDSSGNAVITGVGFTPSIVHFVATNDGAQANRCSGWSDAAINVCTSNVTGDLANCINIVAAGNGWTATVSSMDTDGFTVAWTKVGQGLNLTVKYLAIK